MTNLGRKHYVRRLLRPFEQIIFSNAFPLIPHEVIEEQLIKMGLQPLSNMNFRIPNKEMNYRREIIVYPESDTIVFPLLHEGVIQQYVTTAE